MYDTTVPVVLVKLGWYPYHHGALAIVRSLGRAGVPTYAMTEDAYTPVATVAQMVVARKDIRAKFHGGLLWVDLGQELIDATLADLIGNLCVRLGGRPPELFDPVEAGKQFAALLAARPATLVVLDDVWFAEQLEPFLDLDAGRARFLVTTRVTSVLPPAAIAVSVDQLDNAQSSKVLLAGLPTLPEAMIARLIDATGGWALVVNSANAILRRAIRESDEPATYAAWLAETLAAEGVGALDLGNQHARDRTFAATMRPSLALLSKDERRRAYELSIFAEDNDIDVGLVGLLWNATGGLTPAQARALAAELRDLNLLTDFIPKSAHCAYTTWSARTLRANSVSMRPRPRTEHCWTPRPPTSLSIWVRIICGLGGTCPPRQTTYGAISLGIYTWPGHRSNWAVCSRTCAGHSQAPWRRRRFPRRRLRPIGGSNRRRAAPGITP
jgi:hypothetical protein